MSSPPPPTVLVLNASLGGDSGNTAVLLRRGSVHLRASGARVVSATLAENSDYFKIRALLAEANAFVIGTGTHWDSWSHLLQKLLEEATPDEGTELWLGKPAGVIVTMHSVGGKGVLSRLQGVLNTLGCLIPPMGGLVYSLVNQSTTAAGGLGADDVWIPDDIAVVCHNLLTSLSPQPIYRTWPVDRQDYSARWILE